MLACQSGNASLVQHLFDRYENIDIEVKAKIKNATTALILALQSGSTEAVEILLKHGADAHTWHLGSCPLSLFIRSGNIFGRKGRL
jgi:ankyrin repeat protein